MVALPGGLAGDGAGFGVVLASLAVDGDGLVGGGAGLLGDGGGVEVGFVGGGGF